jgi:hypothetical protein
MCLALRNLLCIITSLRISVTVLPWDRCKCIAIGLNMSAERWKTTESINYFRITPETEVVKQEIIKSWKIQRVTSFKIWPQNLINQPDNLVLYNIY